jgi:endonuclease/exonuclease/phosphatase (EEP) superfamily protein YafD
VLALTGCAGLPVGDELIARQDSGAVRTANAACTEDWPSVDTDGGSPGGLDPAGFSLMSWNVHKGLDTGWREDFDRLSSNQDLVTIQEAHLTPTFRSALEQNRLEWVMVRAFDYREVEAGVLTASRDAASTSCLLRHREPLIRVPKSALVTQHTLGADHGELLVANVHGINFTLGTVEFRAQLEALATVLESHDGPLILAGDFNDWSEARTRVLETIAGRLDLVPLTFPQDLRSRHMGRPVDHVFYRDLEVVESESVAATGSDHNALRATFRVPVDSRAEGQT